MRVEEGDGLLDDELWYQIDFITRHVHEEHVDREESSGPNSAAPPRMLRAAAERRSSTQGSGREAIDGLMDEESGD